MLNIVDFGARPSGGELCTQAIQTAIDAADGGAVCIPRGEFLTGTLNLRNASLYLEKGAVLKGSADLADYPTIGYVHNEMGDTRSLLYAMDQEGIRVYGEGAIDLNGDAFFHHDRPNIPASEVPFSAEQIEECTRLWTARPNQPLFFLRCRHIRFEGITIRNAPCWTLTFAECQDVHALDLVIDNNLRLPNNDGIHVCSCSDVFIRGCNISAGDDCVALSCITNWYRPCERIVISDCIFRSCSKALVVGYMHSIVRDVCISNVLIYESNRALCIMAHTGTGLVENVQFNNCRVDTRVRAGNWWGNGEAFCILAVKHSNAGSVRFDEAAHRRNYAVSVRNIRVSGLQCTTENALGIVGEGGNVQDVAFTDVSVTLKDSANRALKGKRIDVAPGTMDASLPIEGDYWLHLQGVRDVRFLHARIAPFHGQIPGISQRDCQGIVLE